MPGPFQVNKHYHWQQLAARLRAEREAEAARRAAEAGQASEQTKEETTMSDQPEPASTGIAAGGEAAEMAIKTHLKLGKMDRPDRDPATGQFVSGHPGGPGRPPRSRMTARLDALADEEIETILAALLERAKQGNAAASRFVLERRWAKLGGYATPVAPAESERPADIAKFLSGVVRAAAEGQLTPAEAASYGKLAELQIKAAETVELEQRLAALEQRHKEEGRRR